MKLDTMTAGHILARRHTLTQQLRRAPDTVTESELAELNELDRVNLRQLQYLDHTAAKPTRHRPMNRAGLRRAVKQNAPRRVRLRVFGAWRGRKWNEEA